MFDSGTPAEKTIKVLEQILHGEEVRIDVHWTELSITDFFLAHQTNLRDIVDLRDAILSSGMDLHRPMHLARRMSLDRNVEVNKALLNMLSEQVSVVLGIIGGVVTDCTYEWC